MERGRCDRRVPPANGSAISERAFHDNVVPNPPRDQLRAGLVGRWVYKIDTPSVQGSIKSSDRRGISVAMCRSAGTAVCSSGKNEQILDRPSFQHPGRMEFTLAGPNFPISTVEDGFKFPAPNQIPEKIVFV